MSVTLDTGAYLDVVRQLLAEGRTNVPVTVAGTSMTPFLDPGDTVWLSPKNGPVQPGDIVLFSRFNGRYVLHRVTAVAPDGRLTILGDAQVNPEYLPDESAVWGVVTGALHRGKRLDPDSRRWRFFAGPWSRFKYSRYWINRIRNTLSPKK